MIQGGDLGTGVVFTIQGGFLLGGSGASGDRVAWFGVSSLLQIEHVLLGKISGNDRDEMFIKGGFELGPSAEINRSLAKGSFLMILGPFTSSSANAEVCEGRGDLLIICCKVVPIEIVIVFQGV